MDLCKCGKPHCVHGHLSGRQRVALWSKTPWATWWCKVALTQENLREESRQIRFQWRGQSARIEVLIFLDFINCLSKCLRIYICITIAKIKMYLIHSFGRSETFTTALVTQKVWLGSHLNIFFHLLSWAGLLLCVPSPPLAVVSHGSSLSSCRTFLQEFPANGSLASEHVGSSLLNWNLAGFYHWLACFVQSLPAATRCRPHSLVTWVIDTTGRSSWASE